MLYNEAIRGNSELLTYGVPVWEAVLTEVVPEDSEVNSVVPLLYLNPDSTDIQTLLLVQSEGSQHVLSFVPVPDTLPPSAHADSFDVKLVVELCHCYLWCETAQIQYRDGNDPDCYDFGKRSKRKKFRRDQYEEEEGSGYGGPIYTREVTIISFGGYGDYNWMFLDGGQINNGGGGSTGLGGFNATLIDLWSEYYNCLSSSPELAQAIWEKQYLYQGALQVINVVLDRVLDFMCTDLQGEYLNKENFNLQYEYELESFPYLKLYERLGFDHTENDLLFCMEFAPEVVDVAIEMTGNDPLLDPCHPENDPIEMVRDALLETCTNDGELTLEGLLENLPNTATEAFVIKEYVDSRIQFDPLNEAVYLALGNSFNELNCENPQVKVERVIELFEISENDPFELIENCDEEGGINIQDYLELFNFQLPNSTIERLNILHTQNSEWRNQPIYEGNVSITNLDEFSVEVVNLPDLDGDGQPEFMFEVWEEIKRNFPLLASNSYQNFFFLCPLPTIPPTFPVADISWSFEYYWPEEESLWNSEYPLNTIFKIHSEVDNPLLEMVADYGAVIVSQVSSCCFINSSIESPYSNTQPFSGNRIFGYRVNGNGNMEIYTKAIDIARRTPRISWLSFLEGCQADTYYSIADATWTKYQETIKSFIEAPGNNGVATIKAPKKKRIKNESIRLLLESNLPITYVPCD